MNDEPPSDDTNSDATKRALELQMFYLRKTVIFILVTLFSLVIVLTCSIVAWNAYKGGDGAAVDSLVSIANTIATLFEKVATADK